MTIFPNTSFLRSALLADAVASGATGLLMAALATTLAGLLDVPAALLFWAGVVLLPYTALLVFLATRDQLPHWTVWVVIVSNVLWAVDCVVLTMSGRIEPNALGTAFILVQALVVGGFAELQFVALRRIGTQQRYA